MAQHATHAILRMLNTLAALSYAGAEGTGSHEDMTLLGYWAGNMDAGPAFE